MNRRVKISALLLSLIVLAGLGSRRTVEAARPNIIFVLTDDQRWDALGAAGNAWIHTPNLDRLAARGVRFDRHYVTTSICAVSRASILSGQYARRHKIGDFSTPFSPEQWARTYPAILREAGYRTGFIGKFGIGNARFAASMTNQFDYWRGLPGQAGEWFIEPKDTNRVHATARFGDQALEFLAGCSGERPFCLSISFNAPHARDGKAREFEPDDRDEALYTEVELPVPPLATPADFERLPEFVRKSEARRRWEKRFANGEMFQRTLRDYYRLMTGIDRELGRIVRVLEERGWSESTVIVFTSDNGFALGDRGLADKWFMYEESIRVPLIIFDPRLEQGRRRAIVTNLTLNIDLAPTILSTAGLLIPGDMQGQPLGDLMAGKGDGWRKQFFYEHHFGPGIIPPVEGIRTETWAYMKWLSPNPEVEELYDLSADPLQRRNLAHEPRAGSMLARLREDWRRARTELE